MNMSPLTRTAARFLCITSLLLAASVTTACEAEGDADDTAGEAATESDSASDDDGLADDAVCEGAATEVDCGVLLDSDGCGDAGLGDQTAADCSGNDAAAACVIDAANEGLSFSITQRYFRHGGQFDTLQTLHIDGDGAGAGGSSGVSDLCSDSSSYLFEGFDPSACTDADCVVRAMDGITETTYCSQSQTCDEGV